MNSVIVWTIGDIVGLCFLALLVGGVALWLMVAAFTDWKNSPRRWWNKRKR